MIPTKDEIEQIIKDHIAIKYMTIDPFTGHPTDPVVCGVSAAATAIATRLTLPHLMSEFVGLVHRFSDVYSVPHTDGTRRRVWIKPDGVTHCWDPGIFPTIACSDSSQGTTCPHVLAVELYLAREEQSTNV